MEKPLCICNEEKAVGFSRFYFKYFFNNQIFFTSIRSRFISAHLVLAGLTNNLSMSLALNEFLTK